MRVTPTRVTPKLVKIAYEATGLIPIVDEYFTDGMCDVAISDTDIPSANSRAISSFRDESDYITGPNCGACALTVFMICFFSGKLIEHVESPITGDPEDLELMVEHLKYYMSVDELATITGLSRAYITGFIYGYDATDFICGYDATDAFALENENASDKDKFEKGLADGRAVYDSIFGKRTKWLNPISKRR